MGCCGENTTGAGAVAVDTSKRVNYTKGMLLGVDDFVQEQAWGIARRHELAREVLGYGTVRGLKVAIDPGAPRVRVTPGMAWMPSGTPVCVPSEQCCDINAWLAKHWGEVGPKVQGLPQPAALTVYVVLAYDTCLTDKVPVPGEPCRSEEDLTAESRIADCFRLELRLAAPDQVEEDAVRDFADWLAKIPVDASSPPLSDAAFLGQLRAAAHAWLEPSSPHVGDFMFGSPPVGMGTSDELLRAALRLWVTELRPLWRARYGCGPHPAAPQGNDDAVLLAALALRVHAGTKEADADVQVVEDARPILLSLRMVQELIAQNPAPEPAHSVEPGTAFGLLPEVGSDSAYARADHSHGTPTLPLLAGDVTGPITANNLTTLRGRGFTGPVPAPDQVLAVNAAGSWEPRTMPVPGAAVEPALRFGLAVAAGTGTAYAPANHSHGTPTLRGDAEAVDVGAPAVQEVRVRGLRGVPVDAAPPTTPGHVLTFGPLTGGGNGWSAKAPAAAVPAATAVVAQQQFGLPSALGTNAAAFARADHTHGTPTLEGDVVSDTTAAGQLARVTGLQRKPVSAVEPQPNQLLAFVGGAWTPTTVTTGPAPGDFVERERGLYRIVAAGHARVELVTSSDGPVTMRSTYSKLVAKTVPPNGPSEVRLRFNAEAKDARNDKVPFIVKLTPVWSEESENQRVEFSPYLVRGVRAVAASAIEFDVRLRLSAGPEKSMVFELQVEVSRFETEV